MSCRYRDCLQALYWNPSSVPHSGQVPEVVGVVWISLQVLASNQIFDALLDDLDVRL